MEFNKYKLEDICDKITDGSHSSPKATENGYHMYSVKDMYEYGFDSKSAKKVSKNDYEKLVKNGCKPLKNDVLIAKDGSYLKNVFVIEEEKEEVILSSIAILRPNRDLVNPYYLAFYLKNPKVKEELKNGYVSGSVLPRIVLKDFKKLPVFLPDIIKQNNIVNILRHIELKIIKNGKIISNLEQLSQTLFKHWFIDFEFPNEQGQPYKSSGGEMVGSELGEIPKEWNIDSIDSLGTIIGGGTPSKKHDEYYTNNGVSWITPKDLSNNSDTFIYKGAIDITELGLKKGSARMLPEDTVLFSSRAPIGYIAIAGQEVTTNQGFKSIVPNKGYGSYFIYHLLKYKIPAIEAAAGGSTFKEISGKGLKEISIILPTINIVEKYKELVESLFLQIRTLEKENKNLIQLRDTLLPKLLSGEIEIPDELEG